MQRAVLFFIVVVSLFGFSSLFSKASALQAGDPCPEGLAQGATICDPSQSATTRYMCSIGSSPILFNSHCPGVQTCANGNCTSSAPSGSLKNGDPCPAGVVAGQSVCEPAQSVSARYSCANDLTLRQSFCIDGVICQAGACLAPSPIPDPNSNPGNTSGEVIDTPLCNQAGESKERCEACFANDQLWTAVGCIPFGTPSSLIRALLTIGLGIAGSAVLLMTLAAGFLFTISRNDPKQVEEAKSLITSAVTGILFIIFSVTILRYIGVSILQLPAFG